MDSNEMISLLSQILDEKIGMVTAYAYAKSKGYSGSADDFANDMANIGVNISAIETAINTFNNQTVPNAETAITTAGSNQVTAVNTAGQEQLQNVTAEGGRQVGLVTAAGSAQTEAVNTAGTTQTTVVNNAGSTQISNVNNAGSQQIAAIQAKGEETKQSIPSNYTELSNSVVGLKSATTKQYEITGTLLKDNCLIISDGTEIASNLWCASEFIDIYGSGGCVAVLTCTIYGTASVVWYDKDKVKMGYVSSDNCQSYGITAKQEMQTVKIPMPSNVAYVRICAWKTYMVGNMEVCVGAYNDANVVKTLVNRTDQNTSQIQTVNNFIGKIKWKNKVDPAEITDSAYIRATDGKLVDNNQYNDATGFIYLEPNTLYYFGGIASDNFYAFYSSNSENDFVSSPNVTIVDTSSGTPHAKGTITTHDTGYYFRGTIGKSWTTSPYVSDYADMYMPYGQMTLDDMIDTQSYNGKKVLIIGDSISKDAYGNYKKWVTNLIEGGKLPSDTVNSSQHATGFVATYNGSYPNFITRMEAIADKSTYDLVIVFGGINDYVQNIPLGESGQDKTVYFKPAVDYFFNYLIENFTQARICVLLPLRTDNIYPNTAGNKQEVYAQYIHDVAKSYCLPVLNLTEESGFCPFNETFKQMWTLIPSGYTDPDGIHPNAEYEKKYLAPMIWKFIRGLIV